VSSGVTLPLSVFDGSSRVEDPEMISMGIITIATVVIIAAAIYEKRRQERKQAERDKAIRAHLLKHALSWTIETQNDKTPFMSDFRE
jgi:hypothetical protein